jgi:hypothetical protein
MVWLGELRSGVVDIAVHCSFIFVSIAAAADSIWAAAAEWM